ncbi:MAG: hypothetical protein WC952_16370, partial [Desulfobulbaceae bacterium]
PASEMPAQKTVQIMVAFFFVHFASLDPGSRNRISEEGSGFKVQGAQGRFAAFKFQGSRRLRRVQGRCAAFKVQGSRRLRRVQGRFAAFKVPGSRRLRRVQGRFAAFKV